MEMQKQKIDPKEILCYNGGLPEAGRFFCLPGRKDRRNGKWEAKGNGWIRP